MRVPVVPNRDRREADRVLGSFAHTGGSLLVTLPPGTDAAALAAELRSSVRGPRRWVKDAALLLGLADRLDEARPSAVLVPAACAESLSRRLRNLDDPADRPFPTPSGPGTAALGLADLIDQGRPVPTAHPFLLDALRNAFAESLSRPGIAGVDARDELVRELDRFVAMHREAVHPDDEAQLRIQAGRSAPAGASRRTSGTGSPELEAEPDGL